MTSLRFSIFSQSIWDEVAKVTILLVDRCASRALDTATTHPTHRKTFQTLLEVLTPSVIPFWKALMTPDSFLNSNDVPDKIYHHRIQLKDGGQGSSWQGSWSPISMKFETKHLHDISDGSWPTPDSCLILDSNSKMEDRGLLDSVPFVQSPWNLKHSISITFLMDLNHLQTHLSRLTPNQRWRTGVILTWFLMSNLHEIWNVASP